MPKEVACAIIRNDAGQILIGQRQEEGSLPGYWEFPGGKLNKNETPEDCLIREIKEEINSLNIKLQKYIEQIKDFPFLGFKDFLP